MQTQTLRWQTAVITVRVSSDHLYQDEGAGILNQRTSLLFKKYVTRAERPAADKRRSANVFS